MCIVMVKRKKRTILTVAFIILLTMAAGCNRNSDKPPKIDEPLPKFHSGIYESEDAKLTFIGDGKTVIVDLSDRYLDVLGNPPNSTTYNYTFTWYDFGECRYDAATNLRLSHVATKTAINFSLQDKASFERLSLAFPLPDKAPQVLERIAADP